MKVISTPDAPNPAGHYSQAVVQNGFVFVAGQVPIVPKSGEKVLGPIEDQTRQVLRNLEAILKAAGSGMVQVVKTTVYVSDMELWGDVNRVYAEFFGEHKPARAIVPTKDLHHGFKVEIEAIAAVQE